MYTENKENDIQKGWYEQQGQKDNFYFIANGNVTYDKQSPTTKEFDINDSELIVPFKNAQTVLQKKGSAYMSKNAIKEATDLANEKQDNFITFE